MDTVVIVFQIKIFSVGALACCARLLCIGRSKQRPYK